MAKKAIKNPLLALMNKILSEEHDLPYPYGRTKDEVEFEDRATALIGATLLEQSLKLAIETHFKVDEKSSNDMFLYEKNGPLATFSARINLAYAIGVFGDNSRQDLLLIKDIRNTFAHTIEHIDFSRKEISDAVMHIQVCDYFGGSIVRQAGYSFRERYRLSVLLYLVSLSVDESRSPVLKTDEQRVFILR